ncbi:MAG: hypothetical protein ACXW0Q_04445 [Methylovulum sp.]
MNIVDLRKNLRRSSIDRRVADRRKNPHAFGTPEWLNYIKVNNLECPETDRRKMERRTNKERRLPDRREYRVEETVEQTVRFEKKYERIFLTPAELKLIEDVFLNDLE